jgi:ABC-type multidrug transport system ATPase subunit
MVTLLLPLGMILLSYYAAAKLDDIIVSTSDDDIAPTPSLSKLLQKPSATADCGTDNVGTLLFILPSFLVVSVFTISLLTSFKSLQQRPLLSTLRRTGLSPLAMWLSVLLASLLASLPATVLAYVAGYALSIPPIKETNPLILLFLLTSFHAATLSASLFLTSVIRSPIVFSLVQALVLAASMALVIIFTAVSAPLIQPGTNQQYDDDYATPPVTGLGTYDFVYNGDTSPVTNLVVFLMPPYHFGRVLMSMFTYTGTSTTLCSNTSFYSFEKLATAPGEALPSPGFSILCLYLNSLIYITVAYYVHSIRGDDDTCPRPLYFIFQKSYWFPPTRAVLPSGDDSDVLISEQTYAQASGQIRTRKLTKSFPKGGTALKEVSISFSKDECYALLGQNGAGKSTLINVLTGATESTHGNAFCGVHGSVSTNLPEIQRHIGLCPQHDLIFDELTGFEHAVLYSMCRGNSFADGKLEAARIIESVNLTDHKDKRAIQYSGGMKRRLMCSLATVGDPDFIFLDEPSTGLDPLSRRRLWSILADLKRDRVLVLTTHNMEEAQFLGDRIGFLHLGRLRASGTSMELKKQLGNSFKVCLTTNASAGLPARAAACAAASSLIPKADIDSTSSTKMITVRVERDSSSVRRLRSFFEWVESHPEHVEEVALSNSTLSEVFTALVQHDRDEIFGGSAAGSNTIVMSDEDMLNQVGEWLRLPHAAIKSLWETGFTVKKLFGAGLRAVGQGHLIAAEEEEGVELLKRADEEDERRGRENDIEDAAAAAKRLETAVDAAVQEASAAAATATTSTPPAAIPATSVLPPPPDTVRSHPRGQATEGSTASQTWAFFLRNASFESKRTTKAKVCLIFALVVFIWLGVQVDGYVPAPNDDNAEHQRGYVHISYAAKSMLICWATNMFLPNMIFVLGEDRTKGFRHASDLLSSNSFAYWIGNFSYFTVVSLLIMATYTGIGWAMGQPAFTNIPVETYLLMYTGGAIGQVSLAAFFSVVLPTGPFVSLIIVLLVGLLPLFSCVAMIFTISSDAADSPDYPNWLMLFSPFSYSRSVALAFSCASIDDSNDNGSLSNCGDGTLLTSLGFLWLGAAMFGIVAVYLHAVLPAKHGVSTSPLLCLASSTSDGTAEHAVEPDVLEVGGGSREEDAGVRAEKERAEAILSSGQAQNTALLTCNLRKRYTKLSPFVVKGVSLAITGEEVLGLLGPNGAGKTTLISMLTTTLSVMQAGGGRAFVGGVDVAADGQKVRKTIGVCPQHDILYPTLTVWEHLLFACRMRGAKNPATAARKLAVSMDLDGDALYTRSAALSGGMKRRLSIGMALAGEPVALFLDEPTTGLDPETRSQIWTAIKRASAGRVIVLSSHSMEEVEFLSTRIGIMAGGEMLCIGDPVTLKNKFGDGLRIKVVVDKDRNDGGSASDGKIVERIVTRLKGPVSVESAEYPNFVFQMGGKEGEVGGARETGKEAPLLSETFAAMESLLEGGIIRDWEINNSSLEEVFVGLVEKHELGNGAGPRSEGGE